jgi:tRNA A-37 threonylcarbamoyl transferase component Bud32
MNIEIQGTELFDEKKRELLDEKTIKEQVDRIYVHLAEGLGHGKTAEVVFVPEYDSQLCFKIIAEKRMEEMYPDSTDRPKFNSPKEESHFLARVQDLPIDVKTPHPICYWKGESDTLGKFEVLVMERLNAVTVQDILYGQAELPPNFDFPKFKALLTQLPVILQSRGVMHHDITVTNIMIDLDTGLPCIIDFGDAKRLFASEEPTTKDKVAVKDVLSALKNHITNKELNAK